MNDAAYKAALTLLMPLCTMDDTVLKQYLQKRRAVQGTQVKDMPPDMTAKQVVAYGKITTHNLAELQRMIQLLQLKAYSNSTIKTYRSEMMQLMTCIKNTAVDALTPDHLKRYMVYILEKEQLSENTANSRMNAFKFYFEQVLKREKFFFEIPRAKKPLQLPKVLGERELEQLFKALPNKKHKAMLYTAYSAGLRVSEVCTLKQTDIDGGRMQIFVACAKGKKDRYVPLSPVVLDILRDYHANCQPRPLKYVFEGIEPGKPYLVRTAQQVFQNAKEKAGIKKEISFHSLRHSYATHTLEKGIDITYIKELLGHFNIKTTERYLHVRIEKLVNIVSPLDDLWRRGNLEI
jgi:site-specific recombinase XerD